MADTPRSNRHWIARVRELRDRSTREREGVCFVEGIRQVLSANEGGWPLEVLFVDPQRLRSDVAIQAVERIRQEGAQVAELTSREFERISSRDNPVGIAAIVAWRPVTLDELSRGGHGLYVVADQIADAGNLGTLMRTADSLGVSGVITTGGVDPAHPAALRASLGSTFQIPVAAAGSLDDIFTWCTGTLITTVATSARANDTVWERDLTGPVALFLGNEGRGLDRETVNRCNATVKIPMSGSATSLNVGVAAGIILYEAMRQRSR